MIHSAIGWAGLIWLGLASLELLRRSARESHPLILLAASPFLACLSLTLVSAYGLAHLGPMLCLGLATGAVTGLAWRLPPMALDRPRPGWHWLFLAIGTLTAALYAMFSMSVSQVVEDAFFIHTSNMGLIQRGFVPPLSPLGEPLQGHYGKDLLTSVLSAVTGTQFLTTEWVTTVLFQALTFLLLYAWLAKYNRSRLQGMLGSGFAYFGSHFGNHVGLMSCVTNNLPVAFAGLVLGGYLCQRALALASPATILLAGVVLGMEALIYETYFGLMILALLPALPSHRRKALPLLIVAGLVACTVGGALTQIARRVVSGQAHHATTQAQTMQSQQLQLHFPKADLLLLRRDNLRPSRPFDTEVRPYWADSRPSQALAYLWAPAITSSFWYPTWLWPLVALWLLVPRNRPKEPATAWFFWLGLGAMLTPAVVDFGYFNNESARWLIVTAVGLSTSFALMLGSLYESSTGKLKGLVAVALVALIYLTWPGTRAALKEMLHAVASPGSTLPDGSPGIVPGGSLVPNPRRSLAHHYGFTDADWNAVTWLHDRARKGERFLANYADEAPADIRAHTEVVSGGQLNVIGLQVGLTGLFPAGLTGAPVNPSASPMFSPSLQARAFWFDLRPERLEPLNVQWLLASQLEGDLLGRLRADGGLTEAYSQTGREVFRVAPRALTDTQGAQGSVELTRIPALSLETRQARSVAVQVIGGPGLHWVELAYREPNQNQIINPDDLLLEPVVLRPDGPQTVEMTLVGPYYPQRCQLVWRLRGTQAWAILADVDVSFVSARR